MPKDYSIECAKAYASNEGDEASLVTLGKLVRQLSEENKTFSLVLLVDDVTYPDKTLDFDAYAKWLEGGGYPQATVFRESQITPACDELLASIDYTKLSPKLANKLRSEAGYISQLFIASWCLMRLGYLENPEFGEDLRAQQLVNILPADFKPGEEESLEIIRATQFSSAVDQIEYQFI
jgi:hypothetical protein